MELLNQTPRRRDDQQVVTQYPTPQIPQIPADFAQKDWGMALAVCCLVGVNLWQLLKNLMTADNDLQKELIKSLLDERKILLQAVLERKT
jgi:hypothetical protein